MYCKIVIICHYNIIFPLTDLKIKIEEEEREPINPYFKLNAIHSLHNK